MKNKRKILNLALFPWLFGLALFLILLPGGTRAADDPLLEFFKKCTGPNCGGAGRTEEDRIEQRENDNGNNQGNNGNSNGSNNRNGNANGNGSGYEGGDGNNDNGSSNRSDNNLDPNRDKPSPTLDETTRIKRNNGDLTDSGPTSVVLLGSASLSLIFVTIIKKIKHEKRIK